MPKLPMTIVTLMAVLCTTLPVQAGMRAPPPVRINKCCRIGEQINAAAQCMGGGTEKWVPLVLLLQKQQYFAPTGDAPRFFSFNEKTRPTTCEQPELFEGASKIVLFSNGSLFLSERSQLFDVDDYCAEKDAALVCFPPRAHGADSLTAPAEQNKKSIRLRKCCGPTAVYDKQTTNCVNLPQGHPTLAKQVINSTSVDMSFGFPKCDDTVYTLAGDFSVNRFDIETGAVRVESGLEFAVAEYCLEHTVDDMNESDVNVFTCASDHFANPESVPVNHEDIRYLLYGVGLLFSSIFLAATLATGFLLPSNHRVLHWHCQTYYVACLLVGDFLLAITQISGNGIAGKLCITMAICMHFSFLAAFFWLNTMCFNIWWTFRDFRPTSQERSQERLRLKVYHVYAWGVPLLIAGVAVILDNIPKSADDTFLRPRFGEKRCWFYGDTEILTYFYGPIGILIFINFLLFASTARQLTCGLWKRDDVKSTTERAALGRVCLKLVVVMGVTWVADVVSWAVGGPHYFWYLTDLINALQGVLIFIVVGCQPQVWAALKRFWGSKTGRDVMNTTHGAQHSSSSHGLPSIGDSVTNNTTNTTSSKIPMETIC